MSFDPWAEIAPMPDPDNLPTVDLDAVTERSRRVALLRDAGSAVARGQEAEKCPHPDSWFDRCLCPEPCGAMHDRCTECGVILGYCPVDRWDEQPARYDDAEEDECRCPAHDIAAARHEATASSAGFGMRPAPSCTAPARPASPDVIAFWRKVDI